MRQHTYNRHITNRYHSLPLFPLCMFTLPRTALFVNFISGKIDAYIISQIIIKQSSSNLYFPGNIQTVYVRLQLKDPGTRLIIVFPKLNCKYWDFHNYNYFNISFCFQTKSEFGLFITCIFTVQEENNRACNRAYNDSFLVETLKSNAKYSVWKQTSYSYNDQASLHSFFP